MRPAQPFELDDVLVVLSLGRYHKRDHLRRLEFPDIELHLVHHEGLVERAVRLLVGEHREPVLQLRHVAKAGPLLVVWPVVLAVGVEDDVPTGASRPPLFGTAGPAPFPYRSANSSLTKLDLPKPARAKTKDRRLTSW